MLWRQWKSALEFGVPGLLLGLGLAWLAGGYRGLHAQVDSPKSSDRNRPTVTAATGESGGITAMISPLQPGSAAQLLYLVDAKSRVFAVYTIDTTQGKDTVRLAGARRFHWDLQLTEWNNHEPEVHTVEAAVKSASPKSQ